MLKGNDKHKGVFKRRHEHGGFQEFILLAILKEGPLSYSELEEKVMTLISTFELSGIQFSQEITKSFLKLFYKFGLKPKPEFKPRKKKEVSIEDVGLDQCQKLIEKGLIRINRDEKYALTDGGKIEARKFENDLKTAASVVQSQFFSITAATRNTVLADFLLALIKLSAGFLSASVGLLADGADAAIDTASALIVWVGLKLKKEVVGTFIIILMMFITAISIGYESVTKIFELITSTVEPITMPYLVIIVESVALLAVVILYIYQRYVGKRSGSLALISQSVDSKNHIYVAVVVITSALLSIFGIHFIDPLIGVFVATRILSDDFELVKEALSSIQGETDLKKYEMPFEKQWHLGKLETFRTWILYSIKEEEMNTQDEIVASLERTFNPKYVPILSEFDFSLGKDFNFKKEFRRLVKPLLDQKLLVHRNGMYELTPTGRTRADAIIHSIRYRQNK